MNEDVFKGISEENLMDNWQMAFLSLKTLSTDSNTENPLASSFSENHLTPERRFITSLTPITTVMGSGIILIVSVHSI